MRTLQETGWPGVVPGGMGRRLFAGLAVAVLLCGCGRPEASRTSPTYAWTNGFQVRDGRIWQVGMTLWPDGRFRFGESVYQRDEMARLIRAEKLPKSVEIRIMVAAGVPAGVSSSVLEYFQKQGYNNVALLHAEEGR